MGQASSLELQALLAEPTKLEQVATRYGGSSSDWSLVDLDDDVMPAITDLVVTSLPFALVTIVACDGGPRSVGSQMVVSVGAAWGFVLGSCGTP